MQINRMLYDRTLTGEGVGSTAAESAYADGRIMPGHVTLTPLGII